MISSDAKPLPTSHPSRGLNVNSLKLKIYCPNHLRLQWHGHILLGFAQCFFDYGVDLEVWVLSSDASAHRPYIKQGAPGLIHKVLYKLRLHRSLNRLTERRFLASLKKNDIVYTWPAASLDLLRRIKEKGNMILLEQINCSQDTCCRILDDAYRRLGVDRAPSASERETRESLEQIGLADRILTASPLMTESYVESGVDRAKICATSFGWEPDRFRGTKRALPASEGFTVLFVGTPIVRKGIHILLQIWDRAKIRGRLVVVGGPVEPIILERYPEYFNRPDVHWVDWSNDVGEYFRSADVFAFPSLEEGGPLVIYEAMGCGLPAVVSPMGGGALASEKQGIIVLDPYDIDAWADTFRRLDADEAYRRELAEQARRAALKFTWEQSGLKRLSQIMDFVGSKSPSAIINEATQIDRPSQV